MALLSRASCDIASKIVTGRSAKTLFIDVMERSAARPGRQARGLPGQHAAGEVFVVAKAIRLGCERGRHRPLAGAAGENYLPAFGIRKILRVESRKRNDDSVGIGLC